MAFPESLAAKAAVDISRPALPATTAPPVLGLIVLISSVFLLLFTFFHKQPQRNTNRIKLQFQIFLVLKQDVMDAGTNKDVDHALNKICGQSQFAGEQLRISAVSSIYTLKKSLAILSVFGVCGNLIHKTIFRPVKHCKEMGHFSQKTLDVFKAHRRYRHKVVLYLCHTIGSGSITMLSLLPK